LSRHEYATREDYQRAVNLKASGLSHSAVAREMDRARATVQAWLSPGGICERLGIVPHVEYVKEEVAPEKIRVRVQAGSSATPSPVIRVLAVGDSHDSPLLPDKSRFRAMGKLAKERGLSHVIQIGDFADFDSVSHHIAADTIEGKLNNPYTADIVSLSRALDAFNEGLGGHSIVRHLTMGNHERRVYVYENQHPQIEGMLSSELEQTFIDHGWAFTKYGTFHFLGGVGFSHAALNRLGKTYGGKLAESTIGNDAVWDVVIGHSHIRREHRAPKIGPQQHVTILNLGCALPSGYTQQYVYHGQLSGWWYGVNIITIQNGQIVGVDAVPMTELERMVA
jgi:hypothetical protein